MGAYLECWHRAFDFSGRTCRSRYWQAIVWECVMRLLFIFVVALTVVLCTDLTAQQIYSAIQVVYNLYGLCFFVAMLSMTVRRLRDAGHTAKALFWFLLPGIGAVALLCRLCEASVPELNSDMKI